MTSKLKSQVRQNPSPLPHPWANSEGSLEVDIAIVGGGASGLYSAMRLAHSPAFGSKKIAVFDASSRLGGRVLSLKPPVLPFAADIGAMRFLPHQALICSLHRHYGLKTYPHRFPTWSYFVRGRDIRPRTPMQMVQGLIERPLNPRATDDDTVPQSAYRSLAPEEVGLEPAQLIALAISRVLRGTTIDRAYLDDNDDPSVHRDVFADAGPAVTVEGSIQEAAAKADKIGYGDLTPYEWRVLKRFGVYDRRRLFQLGFWDVVQKNISAEAFHFVADGLGYHTIIGTWSAAEAIPWFLADFSGREYESFIGGMEAIVDRMSEDFIQTAKRKHASVSDSQLCLTGWELDSVAYGRYSVDESIYDLVFKQSVITEEASDGSSHGKRPARRKQVIWRSVRAKHVILAVSRGALERVDFDGLLFEQGETVDEATPRFRKMIQCVSGHPLLKTFMWFRTPWWADKSTDAAFLRGIQEPVRSSADASPAKARGDMQEFVAARVFTDLPLRMIYYHGPGSASRLPSSDGARWSMIMAYCDAQHAEYWDSLKLLTKEKHWIDKDLEMRFYREDPGNNIIDEFGVTETFAARMHDQLWRFHVHNTDEIRQSDRESVFAAYMNWSRPPFYGGWHSWNIGYDATSLQQKVMQPFSDSRVFVCGEAFSADQGWIEGALKTAEAMLISRFELSPADWSGYNEAVTAQGYRSRVHYCFM